MAISALFWSSMLLVELFTPTVSSIDIINHFFSLSRPRMIHQTLWLILQLPLLCHCQPCTNRFHHHHQPVSPASLSQSDMNLTAVPATVENSQRSSVSPPSSTSERPLNWVTPGADQENGGQGSEERSWPHWDEHHQYVWSANEKAFLIIDEAKKTVAAATSRHGRGLNWKRPGVEIHAKCYRRRDGQK